MNDIPDTQPNTEMVEKRRGSVFEQLVHVLRDVRELIFTTGFIMRNRHGLNKKGSTATGFVPVENMFEAYYDKPATEKVNGIILGRAGDGEKRNANLIEMSAVCNPRITGLEHGYNNGIIKLRVTREGENPAVDWAGVSVADPQTLLVNKRNAGVTARVVAHGYDGEVVLSHITNRNDDPKTGATGGRSLVINDTAIYLKGLPTSSAGLPTGALWNDSGALKIA